MMQPPQRFHVLDVHGWTRRRQPLQFAWLDEVNAAANMGFRTHLRSLRSRGLIAFGDTRAVQLKAAPTTERSISALIETGWRIGSSLQAGVIEGPRPDVIVCHDAGLETIAAAAMALPRADVVNTHLLLQLRPDALLLAATPFGQQIFNRLAASFERVGGGMVLILTRSAAQTRLARQAGLPAIVAPVDLPTTLNEIVPSPIDRGAVAWPKLAKAFEAAGLGPFTAVTPDEAQVAAEAVAALQPAGPDVPVWTQNEGVHDWLEYLQSLGNLPSGVWLKEFRLDGNLVTVTER